MPIYRDSGLDSTSIKILKFLQNNPNKSFRPKEIADKIGEHPSKVFDRLVILASEKGLVEDEYDGRHVYWHIA